jgi:hypothetical protein
MRGEAFRVCAVWLAAVGAATVFFGRQLVAHPLDESHFQAPDDAAEPREPGTSDKARAPRWEAPSEADVNAFVPSLRV